jgi:hypothetical protein
VAIDLRFWADSAPVLAIAGGVALMGVQRPSRSDPPSISRRDGVASHRSPRLWASAIALVWLVSVSVSVAGFARDWHRNPSPTYLGRFSSELTGLRTPATIYDTELPENVLSPIFRPHNGSAFVAATVTSPAIFGLNSENMFMFDSGGRLQPAVWSERAGSPPGPVPNCGWRLSNSDGLLAQIPITRRVPHEGGLSLRIDVLAGRGAHLYVAVSDGHTWRLVTRPEGVHRKRRFAAPPGLNAIIVRLPLAAVQTVRVQARGSDGTTCVLRAQVGVPQVVSQ